MIATPLFAGTETTGGMHGWNSSANSWSSSDWYSTKNRYDDDGSAYVVEETKEEEKEAGMRADLQMSGFRPRNIGAIAGTQNRLPGISMPDVASNGCSTECNMALQVALRP